VDASGSPQAGDGSDAPEYATVNAALSDLGPVGAAPEGGRRLQAVELRPGTLAVMWLALGESGPVLRGNLLGPVDADRGDDAGGWTEHPIPDVRLPHGFAGQFALASAGGIGGAALEVTYLGPAGAATVNALDHIDLDGGLGREHSGEPGVPDLAALAAVADERDGAALHLATESAARLRPEASHLQALALHDDAHGKPAKTTLAIAAGPDVSETAPIVQAVQKGFAVAWRAPAGTDNALQVTLRLYGEDGIAKGPGILVTSEAAADVAPAIAGLGDGVAAAYVQTEVGRLVVKAYAGDGAQIGQEAVSDPDGGSAIAEIALGSNADDEIAVVYVERGSDAGEHGAGYGNIMLQRYAVRTHDGGSELVELGRDRKHDGADAAAHLTVAGDDPTTVQPAVGRAPSVAGVGDGELAIIWVEGDGARETIRGSVLDRGGEQVLRIDLTDLLADAGIAKGTKPALLDIGDGDFLVSWLQPRGDDGSGYVVMSALYAEASPGAWLAPDHAVPLKAFDGMPDDYAVAVSSGNGGTFIDVIWRQDSSEPGGGNGVYSETYDTGGHRLGGTTEIAGNDAPAGAQGAADTLAAAGLADGQIIVVYAEQGPDGDVDLAAQVFDVGTDAEAGNSGKTLLAVSTRIDEETAINPLANDLGAGLTIARINDVPISMATPVDVGSGWVQLREDGWLTVTPNAGYRGPIAFEYTSAGAESGIASTGRVVINVEAGEAPAAVTLLNQVTAIAEDASTAGDLKVADIAMADGEWGTDGLSLTGLDASMFKIVGNALYLKQGIELDFETKPTLSIEIQSSHAGGLDGAASFALNVASAGETLPPLATDDTFDFEPAYTANSEHEIIDLSDSGYATLQELINSGALVQAGDDVVITLDPGDLADPHQITLKGVHLSALSDTDFKFS
jgi:hypothetical protein